MTEHQLSSHNIRWLAIVIQGRLHELDRLIANELAEIKTADGEERTRVSDDRRAIRDQIALYEKKRSRVLRLATTLGISRDNNEIDLSIEKVLLALVQDVLNE